MKNFAYDSALVFSISNCPTVKKLLSCAEAYDKIFANFEITFKDDEGDENILRPSSGAWVLRGVDEEAGKISQYFLSTEIEKEFGDTKIFAPILHVIPNN